MSVSMNIPYSAQYDVMNKEGHERPPPFFGTPTLIWHLAISPHEEVRAPRDATLDKMHTDLARRYERTREAFFRDINAILTSLQERASYPPRAPGDMKRFNANAVPGPWEHPAE